MLQILGWHPGIVARSVRSAAESHLFTLVTSLLKWGRVRRSHAVASSIWKICLLCIVVRARVHESAIAELDEHRSISLRPYHSVQSGIVEAHWQVGRFSLSHQGCIANAEIAEIVCKVLNGCIGMLRWQI